MSGVKNYLSISETPKARCGKSTLAMRTRRGGQIGLPIYLEATEEGRPVYEKVGFYALKETCCDSTLYQDDRKHIFTVSL